MIGDPIPTALALYSKYTVPGFAPVVATTLAQMKAQLDKSIARGADGIIIFHALLASPVSGNDVSIANFEAFIDYLATQRDAGLVEPTTISRMIAGTRSGA